MTNSMGTSSTPSNGTTIDIPDNVGVPQTEHVTPLGDQMQTTQFSDNIGESLYTQPSMADPTFKMDK